MIRIAICDDNAAYQEIIAEKINECLKNRLNMECEIKNFYNLESFEDYFRKNRVDIVFLDVMIKSENVMNWSIDNIKNNYSQIIFMTSFPECAYNISETNCCYFLLKSRINDETLNRALRVALKKITKKDSNIILVKNGSKNYSINIQDIIYVESFSNDIIIHMNDYKTYTVYTSLKDFEKMLSPNFLRCHKSFIVNMNHIKSFEPHRFNMVTEKTLPIPPKKYKEVINEYKNYLYNL